MNKIVFVSTAFTAPYVIKKIKAFQKAGYDTILYAYNRGDNFERNDNQNLGKIVDLGYFPSGSGYIKKLWCHIWSLKRIFKENDNKCIFILFMFDLALINLLFYRRPYIYHISDLTYAKVNNKYIVSFFKSIDRILVKWSKLTIITSLGFKNFLFPDGSYSDKFAEIPNLLQEDNPYVRIPVKYLKDTRHLSFAFVGLNRYYSPLNIAKVIGEKFPQHKFYFYGNGFEYLMNDIQKLVNRYDNIYSMGRFNSTTELERIYQNIDVLICCYDITNMNVRVAEPNKLYEAIYFNKPIVVSDGTFLQERVESLGIGYAINAMDSNSIEDFISSITVDDINSKLDNISKISTSKLIDHGSQVVELILKYGTL